MNYFEIIKSIARQVSPSLIDFDTERTIARTPTQASSNFITNKEQGDWAEDIVLRAINETSKNYIAVKYGKSDNIIAGENGFDKFFQEFQEEIDVIGKRPDLLIFKKEDFNNSLGLDISKIPHGEITNYVKKAIAGIEVRSSAFLIDKYEEAMNVRIIEKTEKALIIKNKILSEFKDLLDTPARRKYLPVIEGINEETLSATDFKVPGWSASERLIELNSLFKELKKSIKEIQKRDFLSITPKVEDIKVVYKWVETFNVPHFYFQVFFDKVYGISFENMLRLITDPENESIKYFIERDTKNQNKTTIKINSKIGTQIAYKIDEPKHESVRKEMGRGRLLFYVTFKGGIAYLDVNNLRGILRITENEF